MFYARCQGQSSLRKLNSPNLNVIRFKDDTAVAKELRLFCPDQATQISGNACFSFRRYPIGRSVTPALLTEQICVLLPSRAFTKKYDRFLQHSKYSHEVKSSVRNWQSLSEKRCSRLPCESDVLTYFTKSVIDPVMGHKDPLHNPIPYCRKTHFQTRSHTREWGLLASSYLSTCISSAPTGRIFVKFHTEELHENLSGKSKFGYNRTKILGTLREDLSRFYFFFLSAT